MKWWYKFCDKVVELVTKKSNNAGNFAFRHKCRAVWYVFWAAFIIAAQFCPLEWVIVIPAIVICLTILNEVFQGRRC